MRLSLDALLVLDAIERKGSFAAAATELHRVPSAITYTIQKLEQDLDVLIFDRSGHRARLTPAGQELLREGRPLLDAAVALEARVKRVATGWEPELRIAVGDLVDFDVLLESVAAFDRIGGATRLRFTHEAYGGAWDALYTGRADLAIGAPDDAPPGGGFKSLLLGEVPFVLAVAPQHPLAQETQPIAMQTVRGHRAVSVADSSRSLAPRTSGLLTGQPTLSVTSQREKLAAQLAGLGVGYLPLRLAANHIDAGRLVVLQVDEGKPVPRLYAAWPSKSRGNALRWFLDHLGNEDVQRRLCQGSAV
ncbi:LysR family transcriptional regulator [Chitinimonas arctica]|uniref:LysR family transcriptional regulator n=1 Tax=Chitinimonas arctica TaxID=2594795 RepID=A0A516SKN2_9NEIS|nr:LysR family transcriptional regulator [Chitinimonas arctica]QDQ28722.1 LysR family transcriptional regulator [Chitinimonas arctica]